MNLAEICALKKKKKKLIYGFSMPYGAWGVGLLFYFLTLEEELRGPLHSILVKLPSWFRKLLNH